MDEHSQIIAAIRAKETNRASGLMAHDLLAVADRAKFEEAPDTIEAILARYGQELAQQGTSFLAALIPARGTAGVPA